MLFVPGFFAALLSTVSTCEGLALSAVLGRAARPRKSRPLRYPPGQVLLVCVFPAPSVAARTADPAEPAAVGRIVPQRARKQSTNHRLQEPARARGGASRVPRPTATATAHVAARGKAVREKGQEPWCRSVARARRLRRVARTSADRTPLGSNTLRGTPSRTLSAVGAAGHHASHVVRAPFGPRSSSLPSRNVGRRSYEPHRTSPQSSSSSPGTHAARTKAATATSPMPSTLLRKSLRLTFSPYTNSLP